MDDCCARKVPCALKKQVLHFRSRGITARLARKHCDPRFYAKQLRATSHFGRCSMASIGSLRTRTTMSARCSTALKACHHTFKAQLMAKACCFLASSPSRTASGAPVAMSHTLCGKSDRKGGSSSVSRLLCVALSWPVPMSHSLCRRRGGVGKGEGGGNAPAGQSYTGA